MDTLNQVTITNRTYCKKIDDFCSTHNLEDKNYAPYAILNMYWQPSSDAELFKSEIVEIRHNLILLKHELFKDAYEKNLLVTERKMLIKLLLL